MQIVHVNGLVMVPLRKEGGLHMVLDEEDYELLEALGLSMNVFVSEQGFVMSPAWKAPGSAVSVARVILDADRGESVRFLDGDRLNHRRENLELKENGWAKTRARDFLTPWGEKYRKKGPDHVYY